MAFDESLDVVEKDEAEPIAVDDDAWLPEDGEDNIEPEESAAEEPESEDTTPTVAELPKKLTFKAKLLDGEKDVELPEEELPTIYQKANNHDRMRDKLTTAEAQNKELLEQISRGDALAKAKGYADYKTMLEAEEALEEENEAERLSPGNPELGKKLLRLEKQAQAKATTPEPAVEPPKSIRDFTAEIAEVNKRYPETFGKALPEEITQAVISGTRVVDAYAAYKAKQDDAEKQRLLKENKILKTNEANRAKAPVKSVKGGIEKPDPFEHGFDSEY